jgi:hypothetical protein
METKTFKSGNYEIELTTSKDGRTSVLIKLPSGLRKKTLVDIELPCTSGEFTRSFCPRVILEKDTFDVEQKEFH